MQALDIPEWMLRYKGTAKWKYWIQTGIVEESNGIFKLGKIKSK